MPSYRASEPTLRPDFVPPGDYDAEVIDAQESLSSRMHEMITLKLRLEPSGAIVYDHLVFTENAFWKIDTFRAATGEKVMPDQDVEIVPDNLIGRRGRVRLVVEEYKGAKKNKVSAWLAPAPESESSNANGGAVDDSNRPF